MRLSIISLFAAIIFLNTAPGHDCQGRPLPGYEPDSLLVDSNYVDTIEYVVGDCFEEQPQYRHP